MIGGVCGGIAEYFGWNPRRVRIVYFVFTIISFMTFTGIGIIIFYFLCWYVIPPTPLKDESKYVPKLIPDNE